MNFGLSPNVLVHRLANIACTEFIAGENCRIDAFVTLTGSIRLGANCHISTGSVVIGGHGFEMGDGCALSPGVKVFTATDDMDSGYLASFSGGLEHRAYKGGAVKLGKYVVIGANSVVLPKVEIGDEVQVGALSLVNRSLEGRGIYAGAPARLLRPRPKLKYGN